MSESPQIASQSPWVLAIRPKTLLASICPVIVGTALAIADKGFRLLPAIAALACSMLLQIGVNLANDYFDYIKGIDTSDRLGPIRVTYSRLIPAPHVKWAMGITFGLVAAIGLYLVTVGGWPILTVGVASILAALAYSGGPFPLASHALGDLFVFIFFGLVAVCGTYYVQVLRLKIIVLYTAVPVGFLITAILVVNNLRDIQTDRKTGKNTLAIRIGERGSKIEFVLLLAGAYVAPIVLFFADRVSVFALLPLVSLPMAISLSRTICLKEGRLLNQGLADTARLSLIFCLLFSIGLVSSAYFK
jgi:1,4-dihydroxy-2-naphthoate octaprenyltransferase